MTKSELGNKHQCQHCGTRFFDLNKSPITCPKCGAIFHAPPIARAAPRAAPPHDEEADAGATADIVSLEDADVGEDKIAEVADDDVEIEVADDTFLEEEEEDGDDGVDLIDVDREDDEER